MVQAGDADPLPNTVSAQFSVTNGFANMTSWPRVGQRPVPLVNLIQPTSGSSRPPWTADGAVTVGDTVTYEIVIWDDSSAHSMAWHG